MMTKIKKNPRFLWSAFIMTFLLHAYLFYLTWMLKSSLAIFLGLIIASSYSPIYHYLLVYYKGKPWQLPMFILYLLIQLLTFIISLLLWDVPIVGELQGNRYWLLDRGYINSLSVLMFLRILFNYLGIPGKEERIR